MKLRTKKEFEELLKKKEHIIMKTFKICLDENGKQVIKYGFTDRYRKIDIDKVEFIKI